MPSRRKTPSSPEQSSGGSEEAEELDYESSSGSSSEEEREWNAYCEACGGFDDLDDALRCSTCPSQYHSACLTPEQRAARAEPSTHVGGGGGPRGRWVCPQCTRRTQLGRGIDKVLACRGGGAAREYRVKWVHRSYLHTEWVKLAELEDASGPFPGLRRRIKNFDDKRKAQQPDPDLVDGVKPAWLEVERVIAERAVGGLGCRAGSSSRDGAREGRGGAGRQYLCKWRDLTYADCTWEDEADIAEYADAVTQFRRRVPIAELALEMPPQQAGDELAPGETDANPLAQLAAASAELASAELAAAGQGGLTQRRFAASPGFLQGELHPYQLEGLNWMYQGWQTGTNLILANEMGLGKTIQAIAYLAALCHEGALRPHLVVVPLSTLPNWQREFGRFAPQLNVVALAGNAEARAVVKEHEFFGHGLGARTISAAGRRREALQRAVLFHVLLTSYEVVAHEESDLARLEWESLVVDEGHRLKNKEARLFQALRSLRLRHRVLLTGTPLQNDLSELFMLLHFLEPQRFDSLEAFQREFEDIAHEQQVERLHELLRPHLLRRMKADVLRQLPPKREQIVAVELSAAQKKVYRSILTHSYESLTRGGVSRLKNVMIELRKAVQHVYLQFYPPEPRPAGPAWLQLLLDGSGKLALLDRMLQKLRAGGHRVLVYSQFLLMLDVLEWYCAVRGHSYLRLDGSVGTAERQRRIDAYNAHPDRHFLFLLSTRAGGLGINLATADTVILYDSDWNPHNDLQAQARAHRLGQRSGVMVYRLIARSTIEERMMQRAKSKLVLEHVVVRKMKRKPSGAVADGGAGAEQNLDGNELQDLIRFGAAQLFAEEGAEAEAAGPKADAAGKASRVVPTSVAEQLAGRTGGQDGRAVVWTDEAIDQLLDRSKLDDSAAEEDGGGGRGGNDILAGFKVAHFELRKQPAVAGTPGSIGSGAPELLADGAGGDTAGLQQGPAGEGIPGGADPSAAAFGPDAGFTAAGFWEELLAGRHAAVQASAAAALGKGKRQRRKLLRLDHDDGLDALLRDSTSGSGTDSGGEGGSGGRSSRSDQQSDSDYEVGSEEEQEQRAEEAEAAAWEQVNLVPEERERRRRMRWTQAPEDAAAAAVHGVQGAAAAEGAAAGGQPPGPGGKPGRRHRRTKAEMAAERGQLDLAIRITCTGEQALRPPSGWPLLASAGDQLRVWGFSRLQREIFMELVMQHGVQSGEGGAVDWSFLQSKFPLKSRDDVAKYGELLLERVMAAGQSSSGANFGQSDRAPLDALMCGRTSREVLQRVGMLHVLRTALASLLVMDPARPHDAPPASRNLARQGLRTTRGAWAINHDVRLLQGVVKHGYGRWLELLEDAELGLQEPVLAELAELGYEGDAPKKPGPHPTKDQEKAYTTAMRRPVQWLQSRAAKLAIALVQEPGAPDPSQLTRPVRFALYRRKDSAALTDSQAGTAVPGHAQQAQHVQRGQQQLQRSGSQARQGRDAPRVDKLAAAIMGLKRASDDSRQRRLQMHLLNSHMQRLSASIDHDTRAVHKALQEQLPVNLVEAGQRFQMQLQGISNSSLKLLQVLEAELGALRLARQAGQQASARSQQQAQAQPVPQGQPPGLQPAPAAQHQQQQCQQQLPPAMHQRQQHQQRQAPQPSLQPQPAMSLQPPAGGALISAGGQQPATTSLHVAHHDVLQQPQRQGLHVQNPRQQEGHAQQAQHEQHAQQQRLAQQAQQLPPSEKHDRQLAHQMATPRGAAEQQQGQQGLKGPPAEAPAEAVPPAHASADAQLPNPSVEQQQSADALLAGTLCELPAVPGEPAAAAGDPGNPPAPAVVAAEVPSREPRAVPAELAALAGSPRGLEDAQPAGDHSGEATVEVVVPATSLAATGDAPPAAAAAAEQLEQREDTVMADAEHQPMVVK